MKKRIRICGSPAVPNIRAKPSEIADSGLEIRLPGSMIAICLGCTSVALANSASGLKPNLYSTAPAMNVAPDQQQHGLDDLHPGRCFHAAEGHVDHHQAADQDDCHPVVETEQQLDQLAGADHLRDQVEGDGDQRAASRQNADLGLPEPERGDVGKRELAEIAQLLGDQERDDRPADQPAHRVDQAIVAGGVDQAGDAQERGRRHVVAGDREAVLEAGDAAAGGIEIRGRCRPLCRPISDAEGKGDKGDEHADGDPIDRLLGAAVDGAGRKRERGQAGEGMLSRATKESFLMAGSPRQSGGSGRRIWNWPC